MRHICVAYQTIIASYNGLSPSQRQAIIWTNAGILLIRPSGTKLTEILIEIHTFSFKKNAFKDVVCGKATILSRPQCVDTTEIIFIQKEQKLQRLIYRTTHSKTAFINLLSNRLLALCGDHFVYAPSQSETTLHCNVISHWLAAYTKWSLQCYQKCEVLNCCSNGVGKALISHLF